MDHNGIFLEWGEDMENTLAPWGAEEAKRKGRNRRTVYRIWEEDAWVTYFGEWVPIKFPSPQDEIFPGRESFWQGLREFRHNQKVTHDQRVQIWPNGQGDLYMVHDTLWWHTERERQALRYLPKSPCWNGLLKDQFA